MDKLNSGLFKGGFYFGAQGHVKRGKRWAEGYGRDGTPDGKV